VKSYVNFYFTGKIEVSQRKQGFRQEPTEYSSVGGGLWQAAGCASWADCHFNVSASLNASNPRLFYLSSSYAMTWGLQQFAGATGRGRRLPVYTVVGCPSA
jgi:hypothetical protein